METIRIGTEYGGYNIPNNIINENSICYLVGAGDDISFDIGLSEFFSPEIHIFDPTPIALANYKNSQASNIDKIKFHDIGFYKADGKERFYMPKNKQHVSHSIDNIQQTSDYIEVTVKRYSTVMNELNHKRVDLLKLDIEGAEIGVLNDMLIDIDCLPTLLLVEFHDWLFVDKEKVDEIQLLKSNLLLYYDLVYNELNDYTYLKK
jgi:FkbM family methyltransferase